MNDVLALLQWIVALALLRTAYEAGNMGEYRQNVMAAKQNNAVTLESYVNPKLKELFPLERIAEIKRKELRRYKLAQEKKWDNWMEKVSQ